VEDATYVPDIAPVLDPHPETIYKIFIGPAAEPSWRVDFVVPADPSGDFTTITFNATEATFLEFDTASAFFNPQKTIEAGIFLCEIRVTNALGIFTIYESILILEIKLT